MQMHTAFVNMHSQNAVKTAVLKGNPFSRPLAVRQHYAVLKTQAASSSEAAIQSRHRYAICELSKTVKRKGSLVRFVWENWHTYKM